MDKTIHKVFLLDTSVLISNPSALYDFKDNKDCAVVAIADATLFELDGLKKEAGDKGRNAREAIREITKITDDNNKISDTQSFKIIDTTKDTTFITEYLGNNSCDSRIIYAAKTVIQDNDVLDKVFNSEETKNKQDYDVLLLTMDNLMYIRAKNLYSELNTRKNVKFYINVKFYNATKAKKYSADEYLGRRTVFTAKDNISEFYSTGKLNTELLYDENGEKINTDDFIVNEFIIISDGSSASSLGYYDGKTIRTLKYSNIKPYGITPKNVGQTFLIEALMRDVDTAPLVICKGPAGTAKTFLSLAVALENNLNDHGTKYNKILCCRPNVQMDEDLGFLPGDEKEKIAPYFRPIMDNLSIIASINSKGAKKSEKGLKGEVTDIINFANIDFEAVAFMRGRSITGNYIIIDEAQNLTITQVKAIITRAGVGTKIVLIGDPDQIDQPYLDKANNGLSYAAAKMKGSPLCWQITLDDTECVRSNLAMEAAKIL